MSNLVKEVWQINTTGTGGIDAKTDIAMGTDDNGKPAIRIGENVFDGTIPSDLPEGGNNGDVLSKVVSDEGLEYVEWKNLDDKVNVSDIVNNTDSDAEDKPLSAAMGKDLAGRLDNVASIGRFLAIWDATTGLPTSEPQEIPYTYHTGDYYRVGNVGTTNYAPSGSEYDGTASTEAFTEALASGDIFYYDSIRWNLQKGGAEGLVQDVQIDGVSILNSGVANIPMHYETWTFTLEDDSKVNKNVLLWGAGDSAVNMKYTHEA